MNEVFFGDCRDTMRKLISDGVRVQMCVTSPPYFGLRQYLPRDHHDKHLELGQEQSPSEYVANMIEVFRLVRDLLTNDGTLWLNIGDSYAGSWGNYGGQNRGGGDQRPINNGSAAQNKAYDRLESWRPPTSNKFDGIKNKDLIGIPWMLAFALRADGWWLRQEIIWAKGTSGVRREGNVMPESVTDRCTKSHEQIFLLAKSERYFFNADAIKEPAQDWGFRDRSQFRGGTDDPMLKHHGLNDCTHEKGNRRSVWRVNPTPYSDAHFATFPPALIEPCILAGSRSGDTVLDCFFGSGTTGEVAENLGRNWIGCEINDKYASLQQIRTAQRGLIL